jgi:hypothetical protein
MEEREKPRGTPEKSWEMINHLLETGELLLGDGTVRDASNREIISAMLFAASRQPARLKSVPLLDNFVIGKTDE